MRTLELDPDTGDLAVADGRLQVVEGVAAITQGLQMRLRLWQGEWFADTDVGIPYLGILGQKGSQAFAEATFRRAIATGNGIASLDSFSFSVNARRHASVSFRARAATGEPIAVTDFLVGA